MKEDKERNSSIELLKIFGIILIILSHAMPNHNEIIEGYIDVSLATVSVQRLVIVLFQYGGQLGNAIFVICSAWFLLESSKVNVKKIVHIATDAVIISVIFSLGGV